MFHWICPECGQEIPPTVRECPRCEPGGTVSAAPPVESKPVLQPEIVSAPPVRPQARTEPSLASNSVAVLDAEVAPPPPPLPEPAPRTSVACEVLPVPQSLRLLNVGQPLRALPPAMPSSLPIVEAAPTPEVIRPTLTAVPVPLPVEPVPEVATPPAEAPIAEQTAPELPPFPAPGVARLIALAGRLQAEQNARIVAPPLPEPQLPTGTVEIHFIAAPQRRAEPVSAGLTRLSFTFPVSAPPAISLGTLAEPRLGASAPVVLPSFHSAAGGFSMTSYAGLLPLGSSFLPAARPGVSTLVAGVEPLDPPPAAVQRPQGSPARIPAPYSGGLKKNTAEVRQSLQPAGTESRLLKSDTQPRITLPGPALSAQLHSLAGAGVSVIPAIRPRVVRSGFPGWIMSLAVMLVLLVGAVAAGNFIHPTSADGSEPEIPATVAATPVSASPLSKLIEVTGYRLVVDFNGKSEIHYLVVNHSSGQLGGINVVVTLNNANSRAGQPPFARFSFRAPDLGPFESREMVSPIEKLPRTTAIPNWQELRPSIEITE